MTKALISRGSVGGASGSEAGEAATARELGRIPRTAGLGLLGYAVATPVAFMAIGAPGGAFDDGIVERYLSSQHWAWAMGLAYLGAIGALGLLLFAHGFRRTLGSAGGPFWGLSVAGTAAAVVGWFLVGGISVAFAEGGAAVAGLPHDVVYLISEMSNLIAICSSAFFVGIAVLVIARRGLLPGWLRVFSYAAGGCGVLAAAYFPLLVFWLWAVVFGVWLTITSGRTATDVYSSAGVSSAH